MNAYVANPINYLLKPIEKQQLFDTLSLTILRLDLLNESTIAVKTKAGIRILHLSDISCCEYQNHAAIYTLPYEGRITTRTLPGSFAAHIEPLLQDERFLRPHISYVVNMGYVECFTKGSFTLCGGIVVPIAAKQYSEARQAYMEYLMEKKKGQRKR